MPDKEQRSSVQRFGRKNRKDKLNKPRGLFPPESTPETSTQPKDAPPSSEYDNIVFDMDSIDMPDADTDALAMLSSVDRYVKPPVITPQEDRYPPIAPQSQPIERQAPAPNVSPTPATRQKKPSNTRYNIITALMLIATGLFMAWFLQVWNNPQTAFNPLPPSTPFVQVSATPGENIVALDATPDAEGQIFVVITDTPSAPPIEATDSPFPFVPEPVLYAPNSNELGCNWWSIAGTVRDLGGNALDGYRIRVTPENSTFSETVFSGASQAFGAGGYELPLVGTPQVATFTVQLFSPDNAPLSDEITITTRDTCDGNVLILNFLQNR